MSFIFPLQYRVMRARAAAREAEANLRHICANASLPEQQTLVELRRLLERAEYYKRKGCTTREAWGRAAAEWPHQP